ncbi:NAD(P)-binding protein [Phlegmacium glaucopus]|nr:NAD(P)-binding protein [Phlegmacium glaucopus]
MSTQKIVICGAGFLGTHIARAIALAHYPTLKGKLPNARRVQISSRKPEKTWHSLRSVILQDRLLPPVPVDITKKETLPPAFENADVVVSLVGIMHGSTQDFMDIQWKGAENVAKCAKSAGARLIHFSAIGADPNSKIPYARTKGLAEQSIMAVDPTATIIRPSLVFGPEDDFFNRFARLARFLPFLPVFGGGTSLFQPVYVGDLARLVEMLSRKFDVGRKLAGKVIEAGGPQTFTYRELMQMVLDVTGRKRPIISLPFAVGMLQGFVLEKLPLNLFTVTRAQIEQLKTDNIVNFEMPANHISLEEVMSTYSDEPLACIQKVLPSYLR